MKRIALVSATICALAAPCSLGAQGVPSWYVWHNGVKPTVSTSISLDGVTGDFIYAYTIANAADAPQRMNAFYLELPREPVSVRSPADWGAVWAGSPDVSWAATGPVEPTWMAEYETDLASFQSEIRPGTQLSGFSVTTPCGSGGSVVFYATGYARDGRPPSDDADTWIQVPQWRDDAVKGSVVGPGDCDTVADWGNRRPGVDGFLGLVNFASGAVLPRGPVTVQIRFSRGGEQVDRASFQAVLNGENVTSAFRMNSRGDMAAAFPVIAPLKIGRNTLLLSVDGTVSGSRTATDADRFVFEVQ